MDSKEMKTALAWLLVLIVVSIAILPHSFVQAKSKDSKAKDAIVKAIGKAVEGKYSTIKLIQLSKSNVSGYIIAYNTTKSTPIPPTPTPTPTPQPQPNSTGATTTVCLVGDLKGSTVTNLMKGCNLRIALGDCGYAIDFSYCKALKFDKCLIGNHETEEDAKADSNGNKPIIKEALAYCGDHWSLKIGTATLIIGMNSNGDTSAQLTAAKTSISQQIQTGSLKTVILLSHKGGHVPPNSHHPAEAASLYSQLEQYLSPQTSLKVIEVFGHNHVSSSAPSQNWYQAGAGGKSFYTCGTDAVWTFCDNKSLSYLELTISNKDGATTAKFIK